ncbi:MAG TPA: APC family permease [Crinalium sp.]
MTLQSSPPKPSGLRPDYLSFPEVLAQSIANIAPTATPAFVIPLVYASAGNGTWLAYLTATIGLVLISLSINIFAYRSASVGSLYAFIARGLGPAVGVLSGWALVIAYLFTATAVILGFASYGDVLFGSSGSIGLAIFLAAIGTGFAWWIAYKDVKLSAELMLVFELTSAGLVLLLAAIVLIKTGFRLDVQQFTLQGVSPENLRLGLVLSVFSFVGFESATALGDEAKNPLRSIPRAVLASVIIPGLFFVILSYTEVLGFRSSSVPLNQSDAPLGVLATQAGVGFFGVLISIGAAVSFFACVLASLNSGSRILFALSRHGILHSKLGNAHHTNATPHVAITLTAILTFLIPVALLLAGNSIMDSYAYLGTIATFGFLVNYILVAIAAPVYLYRINRPSLPAAIISAVGIVFMLIPLIGSLYPIPPAPFNILPYLFLLLLAAGGAWLAWLWVRSPRLIREIEQDLEAVSNQFSPTPNVKVTD